MKHPVGAKICENLDTLFFPAFYVILQKLLLITRNFSFHSFLHVNIILWNPVCSRFWGSARYWSLPFFKSFMPAVSVLITENRWRFFNWVLLSLKNVAQFNGACRGVIVCKCAHTCEHAWERTCLCAPCVSVLMYEAKVQMCTAATERWHWMIFCFCCFLSLFFFLPHLSKIVNWLWQWLAQIHVYMPVR